MNPIKENIDTEQLTFSGMARQAMYFGVPLPALVVCGLLGIIPTFMAMPFLEGSSLFFMLLPIPTVMFLRTICASCDSAVICCPQLGCSGAVCAWFAYWRFALCVQKTTQASLKAEY